jgi:putative ABC transport system permease protein
MALMRARVALRTRWRAALRTMGLPVGLGLAGIATLAIATAAEGTGGGLSWRRGGAVGLLAALGLGLARLAARLPRAHRRAWRWPTCTAPARRPARWWWRWASAFRLRAAGGGGDEPRRQYRAARARSRARLLRARRAARWPRPVRNGGERAAPGATIRTVPALRGTIVAYGPQDRMVRVADLKELPENAWALRGDRGLTMPRRCRRGTPSPPGSGGQRTMPANRWSRWTRISARR